MISKADLDWLAGVVDSDGCFSLTRRVVTFKVSLTCKNRQLLQRIKSILGCGKITQYGTMVTYRIRDQKTLKNIILPIFDQAKLFTHKYYFFCKAKHALDILLSDELIVEQNHKLAVLKASWNQIEYKVNLNWANGNKPSKSWLIGFIEGDGSFFITKNGKTYVHSFGITQKHDKHVLEWIRSKLKIKAQVRTRKSFYHLETKANNTTEYLIKYFNNCFKGVLSLYFAIWQRSYRKYKGNHDRLKKIQAFMHGLKKVKI